MWKKGLVAYVVCSLFFLMFSLCCYTTRKCSCCSMFGRVCLGVFVCPVHAVTFESLDLETSGYIGQVRMSRSLVKVKVTGTNSGLYKSN